MEHKISETSKMRSMTKSSFNDEKWDKSVELNESMTISDTGADEYGKKIKNLGGNS